MVAARFGLVGGKVLVWLLWFGYEDAEGRAFSFIDHNCFGGPEWSLRAIYRQRTTFSNYMESTVGHF
jgi:hypothetical protein